MAGIDIHVGNAPDGRHRHGQVQETEDFWSIPVRLCHDALVSKVALCLEDANSFEMRIVNSV
jgi:hypothetical protein